MLSGPHQNIDSVRHPDIHARTKTYHTYSLASSHGIPHGLPTQDSPRNPSGNLLEHNFSPLAGYVNDVLFVFGRRAPAHGRIKSPFAILNGGNAAGHRRAVYVHVKDGEEDADSAPRNSVKGFFH